jgi:hypothetical protein
LFIFVLVSVDNENAVNGSMWPIGCNFPTLGGQGSYGEPEPQWLRIEFSRSSDPNDVLAAPAGASVVIGSSNSVLAEKHAFC